MKPALLVGSNETSPIAVLNETSLNAGSNETTPNAGQ